MQQKMLQNNSTANTSGLMSKTVLVTGGAGFIGSNLVDFLVGIENVKIIVLDNLETGDIKNVKAHIKENKIEFIEGDIKNYNDCLQATKNCDIVFHQAALGSVPRSIEKPMDTHNTNVTGFINMLEASRHNSVNKFIYASSSSVYGSDVTLPKVEKTTGNPLSPYAVSKKTNELYAHVYSQLYNMQITGLRYFNVFGPKQNPNGPYAAVIPIFINRLLNNQTCGIYGDGTNKRDFTYVSNVVQANIIAALSTNKEVNNEIYNVAYGATETILDLYNTICQRIGTDLSPEFLPPRKGEIKNSFADISKIKKAFGYEPSISLSEGIDKTIEWYKNKRH